MWRKYVSFFVEIYDTMRKDVDEKFVQINFFTAKKMERIYCCEASGFYVNI